MSKYQIVKKASSRLIRHSSGDKVHKDDVKIKHKAEEELEKPEAHYPPPAPPKTKKADIFKSEDYVQVDDRVRQTPLEANESYQALLDYLLKGLDNDVAKVRAVFYWVALQRIPMILCQKDIPPPDTPVGYLHLVREHKGSYPVIFATLCRRARLPCVIVKGVAKGISYDVGDKVDTTKLKNSWNAVYVNGDWRLVHPHWAVMSAQGYTAGQWAVVECPEFHDDCLRRRGSKSYILRTMVNDFYFLTDPEQFITKCFPNEQKWQLLSHPLSKTAFEDSLFLQPAFYILGLNVLKHKKCVVHSENGKAHIELEMSEESRQRLKFRHKLYKLRDDQEEGEYTYPRLERFVLRHTENKKLIIEIRFPPLSAGHYKLEIYCHDPERRLISEWVGDFRIVCTSGMENCEPLPIVPTIGWGPGSELAQHNITAKTHENGVYCIDDKIITEIKFDVEDDDTDIHADLINNGQSSSDLASAVKQKRTNNELVIKVKPPCEGEYALQVFCKHRGALHHDNVCNYLLQRNTIVETSSMADIRKRLMVAMESEDTDELASAMEMFIENGVEDKGELNKAKGKFLLCNFKKELKESLESNDLKKLDKVMRNISDSNLKAEMGEVYGMAEVKASHMRKLKRLQKAVLEMDSKSISEIRSYPKPPPVVHGVMAATFLLLGNKEIDVKKWSKVQGLISKKGKEGLKRRVAAFKASKVKHAAVTRAKTILSKYDMEAVQIASTGAATFYLWATNMIHEAEEVCKRTDR